MKRIPVFILSLCFLLALPVFVNRPASAYPFSQITPTPVLEPEQDEYAQVEQAILEQVSAQKEWVLGYLVHQVQVDEIAFSQDKTWATAYVILANPETGDSLPTEPGLALVRREVEEWRAILPADPGWVEAIESAPLDLLPETAKEMWLVMYAEYKADLPKAPIGGYLLPWAAGQLVYLSGSTFHDSYIPSGNAHYAFDFFIPQSMFNLYASKAGTVWMAKDNVANGDPNDSNWLVIKDETTSPTTYQLYLHLAQNSIPPSLKRIGATVVQGQFIGIADDTGASTGHHLHFQVHTNPNSYWGTSVDITFADVSINGGRPRRHDSYIRDFDYCTRPTDVCVTSQVGYISKNVPAGDIYIPSGGLTSPANGVTIQSPSLLLSGWANDVGSGLYSAQLRANYNNAWYDIGPAFTGSSFSYTWDLCASGVPDGPVSVAVKVMDLDGNQNQLAGLRHFTKKYACPPSPPACVPGPNQVALFTRRNFEGGCLIYRTGDYANLDSLGDNAVASIRVGGNVKATLFQRVNFLGRAETFTGEDINLGDNRVASFSASSMKVQNRSAVPAVPLLVWPAEGQVVTKFDSLSLSWADAGGATLFQARYTRKTAPVETVTSDELQATSWNLGTLPPGAYAWQVRAFAPGAAWSEWGPERTFTVENTAPATPPGVSAPFSDNVENGLNGWTASGAGLWHLHQGPAPVQAHSGSYYWWFGASVNGDERYSTVDPGDLTSPPISIPTNSRQYLRFWYRYQTETTGILWDQRWVQISVDNGPFINLLQLSDDPHNFWLRSPDIDLSAYAGRTVRIRFHFHTLDTYFNDYEGWYIDDISITADPLPACSDALEPNNTVQQATAIAYGQSMDGVQICPAGDVDFYQFQGNAGDQVVVDIDATSIGSRLDAVVVLLDSDGANALAEHDDEVYGERKDPHLGFRLPHSGVFYLKVIAWNHPGVGGSDYAYRLRLFTDAADPSASLVSPVSDSYLTANPVMIRAEASDPGSGISRVEFLLHTSEWLNTGWVTLGSDWNGADGWSFSYDASSQPDQNQMAFYIRAYDWAGNWTGAGVWNLGIDRTPPYTSILPLPSPQNSTAFKVEWQGYDATSGIDHYDLQWKLGNASWQDYALNLPASTTGAWVIGQVGQTYAFRMRGVDRLGNIEGYPSSAETTTSIPSNVCTSPDGYESPGNDNTPAASTPLNPGESQVHNFCNPAASSNGLNDEDWLVIPVRAGRHYRFLAFPQVESAAASLSLYSQDGTTLLGQASAPSFGEFVSLEWTAVADTLVFLRVRPIDGRVAGNPVTYLVTVREGYQIHLPLIR